MTGCAKRNLDLGNGVVVFSPFFSSTMDFLSFGRRTWKPRPGGWSSMRSWRAREVSRHSCGVPLAQEHGRPVLEYLTQGLPELDFILFG